MHLSLIAAQIVCVVLVAVDEVTRSWRAQVLARGLGYRAGFMRTLAYNVASDAAASLTPLRLGGEPVRFAGIMYCGLTPPDALALMIAEGALEYATLAAIALYVGSAYAMQWWLAAQARLVPALRRAGPWVVATAVLCLLLWAGLRRVSPQLVSHVRGTFLTSVRHARRIKLWALAVSFPLTLIHLLARLAVLPVLVLTLAAPPAMGPVWFGSFVLVYGQLFLPTPAGAGAVDVSFLNGAAGYAGPDTTELLILWRFYTTVAGVILGVIFGVPYYGDALRRWLLRRRVTRNTLQHGPRA